MSEPTAERAMRILQVSTFDALGGTAKVAWGLAREYQARGHAAWLAVGYKLGHDPNVLLIPNPNHQQRGRWTRFLWDLRAGLQSSGARGRGLSWLDGLAHVLADPGKALDRYRGIEDFRFPGTWRLLELTRQRPDVVHCHNLHGGFFDLRVLPWLSRQVPVVLTLHDAWLLSGHCAHSFDCERWKTGCGHCPDLTLEPAVQRDATAHNWRRKREIYRNSRLYVSTPSRWLMQKAEQSMLTATAVETRVIPNGVDLSIFRPADKVSAREVLGIRQSAGVILFAANAVRRNMWKDYLTARNAVALTAGRLHEGDVLFIALGEDAPAEQIGRTNIQFVPYQDDQQTVARFYQAADVYVHAARADTFPNTVLEAMACGTPVVATAVGGIPEQIDDARTGFLVPAGDAEALAAQLVRLLSDDALRQRVGQCAAETARCRFDLRRQADAYLDWYRELVRRRALERPVRSD